MAVYKRNKSWAVLVDTGTGPDGQRRRHYEGGFSTKREAKAAEVEAKSRLANMTLVDSSKMTVEAYLRHWIKTRQDLKPSTREGYERNVRSHLIPWLGPIQLQKLSTHDVNAVYADLLETGRVKADTHRGGPLSPSTVRQIAAILHKALQDALEEGLVARNVADAARRPKVKKSAGSDMRTWSEEELFRFLDGTEPDRLHPVWVVAALTGLRRGEVLGLHWEDVDLEKRTASIRRTIVVVAGRLEPGTPKTGKGRLAFLAPQAVSALAAWRRAQLEERLAWGESWTDTGFVFTQESGLPYHPDRVTDAFRRSVRKLGLPRIRLHDLRHGFATMALQADVPLKVVSEALGHSTISVTSDVYSHVSPGMAASAVDRVARAVFPGP